MASTAPTPISQAAEPESSSPEPPAAPDRPVPALAPPRVLLVDDEEAVRLVVTEFLGELGLPVLVATDATAAFALLEQAPSVELLLSDIRMAGASGIELADQAAALRPDLRIVLMSGYFLPQPVARRFLRKPFRLIELEAVLREELGI